MERTFKNGYNFDLLADFSYFKDEDNFLVRYLKNIIQLKNPNSKDKESEDSCRHLAEWLLDYTLYLIKLKFCKNSNLVIEDFESYNKVNSDHLSESRTNESVIEKRKAKILNKLDKMQKNFMTNNKDLLSEIDGQDQSGMRVEYFVGQDIG